MKVFCCEEILLQHSVLSYRIDLYFPRHKLAIEGDGKGHKDINKCKEIKRKKAAKEHLGFNFFWINLDEKDFDVYVEIGKIHSHINKSSAKSLNLHSIKSKFLKYAVENILQSL